MNENQFNGYIERLRAFIDSWQGIIEKCVEVPFEYQAPFTHLVGLTLNERIVYYKNSNDYIFLLCAIIHELGHVFGSNDPLNDSNEGNFFGWEFCLARTIGLPDKEFICGNYSYMTETGILGDLSQRDALRYVSACVLQAADDVIISDDKIPLNIRWT